MSTALPQCVAMLGRVIPPRLSLLPPPHDSPLLQHSYMVYNYKYPQFRFPYEALVAENGRRSREEPEYELYDVDPAAWRAGDFWDITITYAKGETEGDLHCRIVATNCSSCTETLHVLPQLFFRNSWSWGYAGKETRPWIGACKPGPPPPTDISGGAHTVQADGFERHLGGMRFAATVPYVPGSEGVCARVC